MSADHRDQLRQIRSFPSLIKYLRDELDWPIGEENLEDVTFDYELEELGIHAENADKPEIKQLRDLVPGQPWGVFLLKFGPKRLPIVLLRRVLRSLVKRKRQQASAAHRPTWEMEDLLFVCAHRQEERDAITFVHFAQPNVEGRAARLTSFGWTQDSHNRTVLEFNLPPLRWPDDTTQVADWRNQWLAAFDVEKVTKQFFREIANWYFWALKHIRFPKDAPKEADGHDHVSVIRLITRLIFCWFVKEKGLIPGALFDEGDLAQTLDGFAPDKTSAKESVFYRAILQNLFFATLNTEMDKRGWAREEQNFMAHSLYRHKECFRKPGEALELFKNIPFLNGGLFECLDKDLGEKASPRYLRIDGFSRRSDSQPTVPDFLFFGGERQVDLSADYGAAKFKRATVRGLIQTLKRYNFTIMENTPLDQEVALDPELSGKVFENLLAAYNPETGATARKQTGSFYTPREIVGYMVDEALIAYLKTKLETAQASAEHMEPRLRHLFAYNDEPHRFTAPEVDALIGAIDGLKALDPAVGSGAFPMDILHKLVFILGKLDPRNEKWKERQVQRVREAIAAAEKIEEAAPRERAVRELEQQISGVNEAFDRNELDYGRKLYLIENCIYGVDIQPIAVQIAKMRFFISLIVDQKTDPKAPNLGVRPLPNLETKFVAANTLIAVSRPGQQLLRNRKIDDKEAELRRVRERHFNARTPGTKAKCREQDAKLRAEIAEMLKDDGWDTTTARKLASWDPYNQNASAGFFDPEWTFGIADGFDVVIGNPPYLKERDSKVVFDLVTSTPWGNKYHEGKMDYWFFFLHRAFEITANHGIVSFITSRYWMNSAGSKKLVEHIRTTADLFHVVDIGDLPVFEQVAGQHMLHFYRNGANQSQCFVKTLQGSLQGIACCNPTEYLRISVQFPAQLFTAGGEMRLYKTALELSNELTVGDRYEVTQGVVQNPDKVSAVMARRYDLPRGDGVFVLERSEYAQLGLTQMERSFVRRFYDEASVRRYHLDRGEFKHLLYLTNKNCPSLRGLPNLERHLRRYKAIMDARRETVNGTIQWFQLHWPRDPRYFESPKVVLPSMFASPRAAYVAEPAYFGLGSNVVVGGDTAYSLRLLCALLNSRIAEWWFTTHGKKRGVGVDVGVDRLRQFPLPRPSREFAELEKLTDEIHAAETDNTAADAASMEREIDQRVYALYGLTADEIKIVEDSTR